MQIDDLTLSTAAPATAPPSSNNSCPQRSSLNNTSCPTYSWGTVNQTAVGKCIGVSYAGSVCRHNLNIWQQCSLGQAGNVRINDTGDLMTSEADATTFTNLLSEHFILNWHDSHIIPIQIQLPVRAVGSQHFPLFVSTYFLFVIVILEMYYSHQKNTALASVVLIARWNGH